MQEHAIVSRADSEPAARAYASSAEAKLQSQESGGPDVGSTYRSGFGEELPVAVYRSVFLGFACMLVVAWLAFGGAVGTDLDLGVVTVLCAIFLLLPLLMHHVAAARAERPQPDLKGFLSSRFETATGSVSAWEAWLQIVLIPIALAIAAVLIGGVYAWLG
jgi:hypothetical protein